MGSIVSPECCMEFALEHDVNELGLGPGLLESAYEECLCYELEQAGLSFSRQVPLPILYREVRLDCAYRLDIVVEKRVIVELKAIETLQPPFKTMTLTAG